MKKLTIIFILFSACIFSKAQTLSFDNLSYLNTQKVSVIKDYLISLNYVLGGVDSTTLNFYYYSKHDTTMAVQIYYIKDTCMFLQYAFTSNAQYTLIKNRITALYYKFIETKIIKGIIWDIYYINGIEVILVTSSLATDNYKYGCIVSRKTFMSNKHEIPKNGIYAPHTE